MKIFKFFAVGLIFCAAFLSGCNLDDEEDYYCSYEQFVITQVNFNSVTPPANPASFNELKAYKNSLKVYSKKKLASGKYETEWDAHYFLFSSGMSMSNADSAISALNNRGNNIFHATSTSISSSDYIIIYMEK